MKNSGSKSWVLSLITIACGIVLAGLAVIFLAIGAIGVGAVACKYAWEEGQRKLDLVQVGDTRATVIAKMGTPSHIETSEAVFGRYIDSKCQDTCAERIWYEERMCLDIQAWAVELDSNNKVIDKFDVTSP